MLAEPQPEDQPGHNDNAASDAKQAADQTGNQPEGNSAGNRDIHPASVGGAAGPASTCARQRGSLVPVPAVLVLIMVLAATACSDAGGDAATTIVPEAEPAAVVERWLSGVATTDLAILETYVEPTGIAVLASVENRLRSDETVALIESGFSDKLAVDYWASFRADFEAIRGFSVQALTVGERVPITDQPDFTAVEVISPEGTGLVILRRTIADGWRVDTAATMGPALVGPLGEYLLSALEGDNAETIAEAYRTGIVPGLDAAISLDPDNTDLAFETEYIRQLLTG